MHGRERQHGRAVKGGGLIRHGRRLGVAIPRARHSSLEGATQFQLALPDIFRLLLHCPARLPAFRSFMRPL